MPDTREKLVELLMQLEDKLCDDCGREPVGCAVVALADHLIANGVTFQKWIPVSERLPKLIPCGAGTAYSEAVNVLTFGHKVLTAIWDGTSFITDAEFWEAEDEEITHWIPVLLPLPAPLKGEFIMKKFCIPINPIAPIADHIRVMSDEG